MALRRRYWTDGDGNRVEIMRLDEAITDPAIYIGDSLEDDYSEDSMP